MSDSDSDTTSLFRRALLRRTTQPEPTLPPTSSVRVELLPESGPMEKAPSSTPRAASDEASYRIVGRDSAIDLVDPSRRVALVVEDNEVIREGISTMLVDDGWVVFEADSLDRARALLGVLRPHVLVLDYDLQGEYSSVLLDELTYGKRMVPTVLVSACPLAIDAARSYAIELLQKPFGIETLLEAVDRLARRPPSRQLA